MIASDTSHLQPQKFPDENLAAKLSPDRFDKESFVQDSVKRQEMVAGLALNCF
jgi:hypothetical protein